MFKAMALICSAWIANGEAKQAYFTHMFGGSLKRKRNANEVDLLSCQRTPPYHNVVLGECIKVNKCSRRRLRRALLRC